MHDVRISLANDHVDQHSYRSAFTFHAQTCTRFDSRLKYHGLATELGLPQIASLEFGEYSFGGERTCLLGHSLARNAPLRRPSAARFTKTESPLEYEKFSAFLERSFMVLRNDEDNRRPYPSGGALYSVQVTIFVRHVGSVGTGAYHVLPCSRELERLQSLPEAVVSDRLFLGVDSELREFDFAILYSAIAAIPLAKYRNRGYRLALVEVGSMYQVATQNADLIGISNRVWGGFDDDGLSIALGLDPRVAWPVMCQIFGRE